MTDQELLVRFAEKGDEGAFAQVVRGHVDLVYGAARRQLGEAGAEDVVQAVFLLLSKRAGKVGRERSVVGWLFKATRYCCLNARRVEKRRAFHEREAGAVVRNVDAVDADVSSVLDEGLGKLSADCRDAVLMRYLEGRSIEETAVVLGISEAAAKRAGRGLEKLRGFFAGAGFKVGVAGVVGVMAAEAAKGAPVGLTQGVLAGVGKGVAAVKVAGLAQATGKVMLLAQVKMAAAVVIVSAAGVAGIVGGAAAVGRHGEEVVPVAEKVAPTTEAAATLPVVDETKVTGGVAVAQYEALVEPAVAEEIVRLTKTESVYGGIYDLRRGNAGAIRAVMRDAKAGGHVGAMSAIFDAFALRPAPTPTPEMWTMNWGRGGNEYFELKRENATLWMDGGQTEGYWGRAKNGEMELKIDLGKTMKVTRTTQVKGATTEQSVELPVKTVWTGVVKRGEAMVLVADLPVMEGAVDGPGHYEDVIVTEAFGASEYEGAYVNHMYDVEHWLEMGPVGARGWADRAWVWQHENGVTAEVAAKTKEKWTRKLSDGTEVSLAGVGSPAKWAFCWWDGDGAAVVGDWYGNKVSLYSPLVVGIEVRKPGEDFNTLAKKGEWDIGELYNGMGYPLEEGESKVAVYVPTKEWKERDVTRGEDLALGGWSGDGEGGAEWEGDFLGAVARGVGPGGAGAIGGGDEGWDAGGAGEFVSS